MKQVIAEYMPNVDLIKLMRSLRNGVSMSEIPEFGELAKRIALSESSMTPHATQLDGTKTAYNSREIEEGPNTVLRGAGMCHNESFQIPQLISPTVTHTNQMNNNAEHSGVGRSMAAQANSNYNWDERSRLENTRSPTIVEGMAFSDSSGYLGATSSASFLNLVGGGYFMHSKLNIETSVTDNASNVIENSDNKLTLEVYVNKYFETYHPFYPLIYWPHFIACFNGVVIPPSGWESLLYIVAAIGSFLGATNLEDVNDLVFFEKAKSFLTIDSLETGNLILVQTLTLMSNYLQKRDRPNTGYNYLGLAARMAMGLGIHKYSEAIDDLLLEQESRRRIWWCLFIFDCGQTCTFGRPLGIDCSGVDALLPRNFNELELNGFMKSMPEEVNMMTSYSSLRLQSLFHLLTNSIYERLISAIPPSAESLLKWDETYIERWKSMVPSYYSENTEVPERYKLPHKVMHWRCKNLRILMYRTFVFNFGSTSNTYEKNAKEICLEECHQTIVSMNELWKDLIVPKRMSAWYSLFFIIPAVVMPLVCLRNDPSCENADCWKKDIQVAIGIIQKIQIICPPASRVLDLINIVGGEYLPTTIDQQTSIDVSALTSDVSPATQLMQLHSMLWPGFLETDQEKD